MKFVTQTGLSIALLCMITTTYAANWLSSSGNIENTRASKDTTINTSNVKNLQVKWQYKTFPDASPYQPNLGSVSITPAVEGDYVYFLDFAGNLYKNRKDNGQNVWKKNLYQNYSTPGYTISASRTTPVIAGNLLILGSTFFLNDQLCSVIAARTGQPAPTPAPGVCHSGDGAIVIAVNKNDGSLVWRSKIADHPAAKVTGSVTVADGKVFAGIGSWEEEWARVYPDVKKNPDGTFSIDLTKPYQCCSVQGGLAALDLKTGNKLWVGLNSIGLDADNQLPPALHQLLTVKNDNTPDKGFFGVASYGHNPTIDLKRNLVIVANSQTETAPEAAEQCEQYRRYTLGIRPDLYPPVPNPDNSPRFQAAGVTCATLNSAMKTYGNAVVARDLDTGKVKWAFYARPYDAWNHACAAPDFLGWTSVVLPFVFPFPVTNAGNCFQNPIGPDYGFGSNPLLIRNVGKIGDILAVGQKDGRIFGLSPDTGKQLWVQNVDPGSVYGGIQFGMATDGKSIFTGTNNGINNGRDRNQPFVSVHDFLAADGLDQIINGPGLHEKPGAATNLHDIPAPGIYALPFPTPFFYFLSTTGSTGGYPNTAQAPGDYYFHGSSSGPMETMTLVNMPSDVTPDNVNVWQEGDAFKTIAGTVASIDAATGKINWQRPAIDGISGTIAPSGVFGTVTISNGIVFAGYADGQGTLVGLDAKTGKKLFQYNNKITYAPDPNNPSATVTINFGSIESGPAVVDGVVYWGIGTFSGSLFPSLSPALGGLVYGGSGNSLIAFSLPACGQNAQGNCDGNSQ